MRHLNLEKSIKKLDRDIEALKIAKKYLSNIAEIEEIRECLNGERQALADELYSEDAMNYDNCRDHIESLIGKELYREEQKKLLVDIKDIYGRNFPNPSKDSNGLNAWLKEIDVDCEWKALEDTDWSVLVINGLKPHRK